MSVLAAVLACLGAGFMAIAALGVVLMPDVYQRLHCAAKSASLGVSLVLIGAALGSGDAGIIWRCVAAALFFLLTAPVGCHILARAAYRTRAPLAPGTLSDDWSRDAAATDAPGRDA
jgi:multicomponent Na+:H+ antiporter subunit G